MVFSLFVAYMIPSRVKTFLLTLGIFILLSLLISLFPRSLFSQDSSPPSPDFDGNGIVDIPDFLIFVDSFGKAVNRDSDEPTATVPSNVVVENGDSKLTVRWDAVPDEEGKPSVTGFRHSGDTGSRTNISRWRWRRYVTTTTATTTAAE